jgi:amino acid adenylation domain-containing protein
MDVIAGRAFSAPLPVTVSGVRSELPAIEPAERGRGGPLSFAQQRLWLLEQPGGPGSGHPTSWRCRLRGELDREVLRRALERIAARHDVLRATFRVVGGEPEQRTAPVEESGFLLLDHDLSGHPEFGAQAELGRVVAEEADAPFSLERGPLVRGRLIRLGARDHVLLVTLHPLVSDAASLGVFAHELGVLYAAFLRGEADPLPALPVQYTDYAAWQRRLVDDGMLRQQAEYWQETLADAPEPLELPADRPRPEQPDHAGALVRLELDGEMTAALRALGSRHGATLPTTLLAGWATVLGRLSGQTDLVLGASTGSRARQQVDGLVGCFEHPLPVRVDLSGWPTAAELLGRVEARVQEALRNQDLPFQRMVELVQPDGAAPPATQLFRAAFAWRDAPRSAELPGLRIDAAVVEPRSTAGLDLSLEFREEGGGVAGEVVFATALFERETVERYTGYLRRVLGGMAADAARPVDRLALLSDDERRRVVEEWNRTEAPYPGESYIHERFEAQAGRTPDAVAVVYGDRHLTYGELNARANRLAHHLRDLGVRPDARVAICVERGLEMVVAVLGVLKAGGAYLPLDPGYPRERLLDMVQDSAPVVLLTQGALAGRLAGMDLPLLALDEDAPWWGHQPASDPERAALTPENLTYVIYTSGSTGRPKGVEMTHRGASNLLHWYLGATRISERDSVLVVTSFSFHLTQRNLLAPLFVGGQLHLAREPFEPRRIAAQIVASGITMMNVTPTGFQALVEADGGQAIGGLRIVVFGGEPLYPRQLARVPEPRPVFLNPYGATEATGITTHHFARAELASYPTRSMPPGRPIANASIYVLDGAGAPVPVGVTGELYLGGAGVTRGYRRLPGQTAERFLPDPFGRTPGARLYRTGDLGRWLPDGTIEFMGRGDAQVKVRGFRIELGEIEARLAEHPAVHEVVVVARDGEVGDPRLVAYYVGGAVGAAALRAHLAERLPEYMIPAAFVFLDALPVNPNGKLDRKALPAPEGDVHARRGYEAPETETEAALAEVWSEVLGAARVGRWDDFFELGGHSLLAVQVVSRVRQVLDAEVALAELFERPVLADFARVLGAAMRAELPPIEPVERGGPLALSFAQERLWFLEQLGSAGRAYHISTRVRLKGELDREALERALVRVVERHEALRTVFHAVDGEPVQRILPVEESRVPLLEYDLAGRAPAGAEPHRPAAEADAPFDLERGPLVRGRLFRLGADDHVLVVGMHHIVSDGWSMEVFNRELDTLYAAFRRGEPDPLPPLPVQYADYAAWQRQWLTGEVLERQLSWWRERLAGAPPLLELPMDRPRPPVQTYRGAACSLHVSPSLSQRIHALSRREGATLFMTLLAALDVLLARYSGQNDVMVGTPIANRTRSETEGLIGFFLNTLPLRTDLSGDPSFRELLGRVRETALGAYAHQDVPFEHLLAELNPPRSLSHSPVFQVMFNLLNFRGSRSEEPPGTSPVLPSTEGGLVAKFDLELYASEEPQGIRLRLVYNRDLFEAERMRELLRHLEVLLEGTVSAPDRRIFELPLLAEAERLRRAARGRRVRIEHPFREFAREEIEQTLHGRFERQARLHPERVAVRSRRRTLTYAELDRAADRVARVLRAPRPAGEERVALLFEHDAPMIVGILGALKAGKTYVPLDPLYPHERVAFILEDSGASAILTNGANLARARELAGGRLPVVDVDAPEPAGAGAASAEADPVHPGSAAYILYTSGSTGRPKGVVQSHRNVLHHIRVYTNNLHISADDTLTLLSSYTFDAAVMAIYGALLNGATLCPFDWREDAAMGIAGWIREEGITLYHSTPTVYRSLVEGLGEAEVFPRVRLVVLGGEEVQARDVERFREHFPRGCVLVNGLGPTESTVTLQNFLDHDTPAERTSVSMGYPVEDTEVVLRNEVGEQVAVHGVGEIVIRSPHVALGYWGRPELTAAAFPADGEEGGRRSYRTGDLGRLLPDGGIEYVGRRDFQVKIRGHRVEVGEIEVQLREVGRVREAVVVAREQGPGDRALVAYLVPGEGAQAPDAAALRARLAERLPGYMVPAAFVVLERLPLTPSGKVDRQALPAPERTAADPEAFTAPRTVVEEALCRIWEAVLQVERVGIHDNFFELGGHSLLAMQVVSRLRQVLEVEVAVVELFARPVLADFACALETAARAALPPVEAASREGRLPLSFAQQRLWFLEQLDVRANVAYLVPAGVRLRRRAGCARRCSAALERIVARHEALRTWFDSVDGTPVQAIAPPDVGLPLACIDLSAHAQPQAELERHSHEEATTAFDLSRGPLIRGRLLRLADDDHVLLCHDAPHRLRRLVHGGAGP